MDGFHNANHDKKYAENLAREALTQGIVIRNGASIGELKVSFKKISVANEYLKNVSEEELSVSEVWGTLFLDWDNV